MENKFFSIVVTTFNSINYIDKTIKSILKQNYSNYEILLIDDCSHDNTVKFVKEKYNHKVKIFSTEKNFGGPGKSRNIGIEKSKGNWISFLDADDFWFQNRLYHFYDLIIKNPKYEVFCSNEILINKNVKKKIKITHGPYSKNFFEDLLLKGNKLSPSSTVIKKEFLIKKNIFFDINQDLIGVEDYDFWLNLSKNKAKFFFTSKILNAYVIHGQNITNNSKTHLKNTIHVIEKNFKYLNSIDKKIYQNRLFEVKFSYILRQLLAKKNILYNIIKFLVYIINNPISSVKFIFKKII